MAKNLNNIQKLINSIFIFCVDKSLFYFFVTEDERASTMIESKLKKLFKKV